MIRLLAAAVMIALAAPAFASHEPICGPRAAMLAKFFAEFDEEPAAEGVTFGGQLLEIVASPSGTWSAFTVSPQKIACLSLSGSGWLTAPKREKE